MVLPLILASASARRQMFLNAVGLQFSVSPVDIDETPRLHEPPLEYVRRMAREKAEAVNARQPCWVLTADTVVVLGASILGKATDDDHAVRTLKALSGQTHEVHTAVVFTRWMDGVAESAGADCVTTQVRFRSLPEDEIRRYVLTGDGRDKAGAYGIQGQGGALIDCIDGSYSNVVGLPVKETLELLKRGGFELG